ncbi:MAG: LD-carboxypeptidase [Clostridium sp.]|nr:LD-carboxypeptidase [Clostridium sp.]
MKVDRLSACVQCIAMLGYQVELGNSTLASCNGYFAGSDILRAADINRMFADPDIQAIFCLRGGYGGNRILDLLDYNCIHNNPKIFVGYSDVTTFHLAFYSLCDLATFHGPMVSSNMVDDFDCYTRESFERAIRIPKQLIFENPQGIVPIPIIPGKAKGRIIGGCLSLVSPSIGTFYQPDFRNSILFLEDVDESLPRCDKMMHHLKNSGIFSKVNGVILGTFTGCTNSNLPEYTMYDFFCDFFHGYNKPVLFGLQSGHGKPMGTIPLGAICTLDTEDSFVTFENC